MSNSSNSSNSPQQTNLFDTPEAALTEAFSANTIGAIKSQFNSEGNRIVTQTVVELSYACPDARVNYFVTRFIGLEIFLPSDAKMRFRNNRAAHAAVDYLLAACHTWTSYQAQQRYEHEKEIFMNWKQQMKLLARRYRVTPEQLASNIKPAYESISFLKPNYLPIPHEILSFEEKHNVSRKRNIILGVN